jgi:glycosyltransferase involved in cell wall biosynthesis
MKFRSLLLALFFLILPSFMFAKRTPKTTEFVVVIPTYNNEKWCIGNLESVISQSYPHFSVLIYNDCSADKTGPLLDEFIKTRNLASKCTIVHNSTRKGALQNIYDAVHTIAPHKVVVTLDGDDRLAHPYVLHTLAYAYADDSVWMTYGNFRTEPANWGSCCAKIPSKIRKANAFRSYKWVASHPRTFYAKLFQLIKKEDLLWNGQFFPMTWDMAFMFPMLEMSANKHFKFIKDVLYIYNVNNPINDHRVNAQLQRDLDEYIRNMPPYQPLDRLF